MVKKTTQLYRTVENMLNNFSAIESEYRSNPTPRAKAQLTRCADRMYIMNEIIHGLTKIK